MTTRVLTPSVASPTVDLSARVKRKQIVKTGTITYEGKQYVFDKPMMVELAKSWAGKARDMVPFLLAGADNKHTSDPTRVRGQVVDLEVTDDGIDAVMRLSDDAARLTDEYPDFGVSARLVPNDTRADGKTFPWTLEHVLGTINPRLTGMRPWADVNLSDDDDTDTVDLSTTAYDTPEAPAVDAIDLSHLSVEAAELAAIGMTAALQSAGEDVPEFTLPEGAEVLDFSDGDESAADEPFQGSDGEQEDAQFVGSGSEQAEDAEGEGEEDGESDGGDVLTDEDMAAITAALEDEANADQAQPVGLSSEVQDAIDLANARTEQAVASARESAVRVARAEWAGERATLLRKGVPPVLLDLAAPFLSTPDDTVLDLSSTGGDGSVSVAETLRKILAAAEDTIDLARETGTADGGDGLTAEDKERHAKAERLGANL